VSLKEMSTQNWVSNCPQVLKLFYDWRVRYHFWRFWYL